MYFFSNWLDKERDDSRVCKNTHDLPMTKLIDDASLPRKLRQYATLKIEYNNFGPRCRCFFVVLDASLNEYCCPSIRLSICLSVCLSVCLSIYPSALTHKVNRLKARITADFRDQVFSGVHTPA